MNTVSNTAYYCCGARMLDAEHPRSLCRDVYAKRFMDERGMQIFEPFKSETMPNINNSVRCYSIDEAIRRLVKTHRNALIVTVGAGFDSRPYRIQGGQWVELDEPHLMEIKNEKLPISECRNELTRISIQFAAETLLDKLAAYRQHKDVILVIEGVFMYLDDDAITATIRQLQTLFPRHILLCDLMSRRFFELFVQRIHRKLVAAGGRFTPRPVNPAEMFLQLGYQTQYYWPNFKRANELGVLWDRAKIPSLVFKLLYRTVLKSMNGYGIHQFKFGNEGEDKKG